MFSKHSMSTKGFVKDNRNLFEDVSKQYSNTKLTKDTQYTILDYERILSEMCEYIRGYVRYKEKGENTYGGKVLNSTLNFYNSMFSDHDKYRHVIVLSDFKNINSQYLTLTKQLQTLMEEQLEALEEEPDNEMKQLLAMTDNQYKKLSRVYRDDMKIYLWLTSSKISPSHCYTIDPDLRSDFNNDSTPVMHVKKKGD